jgi:hypothetical protein
MIPSVNHPVRSALLNRDFATAARCHRLKRTRGGLFLRGGINAPEAAFRPRKTDRRSDIGPTRIWVIRLLLAMRYYDKVRDCNHLYSFYKCMMHFYWNKFYI